MGDDSATGTSYAAELFQSGTLPEQHEDQLQLGFRMVTNAFNSKAHSLEQEASKLRLACEESKGKAQALQRKNSALEVELVEGKQKAQQLSEENKELFKTVQQLQRQMQRLEGLKKRVMDSLANDQHSNDDDSKVFMREDYLRGAMPLTMAAMSGESTNHVKRPPGEVIEPMPNTLTAQRSAPQFATASSATAPSTSNLPQVFGGDKSNAAIDGKLFFREARSNLSYEAFNEFLANIKRLNNQQQTREQTLEDARRIFGPELEHLYKEFEQLLNRHSL